MVATPAEGVVAGARQEDLPGAKRAARRRVSAAPGQLTTNAQENGNPARIAVARQRVSRSIPEMQHRHARLEHMGAMLEQWVGPAPPTPPPPTPLPSQSPLRDAATSAPDSAAPDGGTP
jgi:hypothetical protein